MPSLLQVLNAGAGSSASGEAANVAAFTANPAQTIQQDLQSLAVFSPVKDLTVRPLFGTGANGAARSAGRRATGLFGVVMVLDFRGCRRRLIRLGSSLARGRVRCIWPRRPGMGWRRICRRRRRRLSRWSPVGVGAVVGPASVSMAAAAMPYVSWLSAAAGQAASAAAQGLAAATAFEVAHAATVRPLAVTGNRTTWQTLLATNFFGINLPAIAATEFQYVECRPGCGRDAGVSRGGDLGGLDVGAV